VSLGSEQCHASSDSDRVTDEGSEEQMKKKLKALEDKVEKLTGTNTALTDTVKAFQKEKACRVEKSGSDHDSSDNDNSEDSPLFFSARKVCVRLPLGSDTLSWLFQRVVVTGRSNPDAVRQKKLQPQGNNGQRHEPAQRQDTPLLPIPSGHVNTPECIDSPVSVHSPSPPSQPGNPPPSPRARAISLRTTPATVPARPWPPAPFAPGVDSKAPKTANKVFSSIVARMLTEAQHKFECLLFVEDAYPGIDTQVKWSIQCWETICLSTECYYSLSKEMMNLVRDNVVLNQLRF